MKKIIIFTLFVILNLTVSAQVEIRDLYENLAYECLNSPANKSVTCEVSIVNTNGRRHKKIFIGGIRYSLEPKRDADGNIVETQFDPDTLKGVDKFVYDQFVGTEKTMSQIEHILENTRMCANELYWWERHDEGKDSIMVSLAYKNRYYKGAPLVFKHNGHTSYESAEVANYSYKSYSKKIPHIARLTSIGDFVLSYYCLMDSLVTDTRPFDTVAYKQTVLPLLQDKRIKHRPVSWTHDEGYFDKDSDLYRIYFPVMHFIDQHGKNVTRGSTTGTIYTLKAEKAGDEEAIQRIMEQFVEKTSQYVNAHPEQRYTYYPAVRVSKLDSDPETLVRIDDNPLSTFHVMFAKDDEGYHILLLQTEGVLWVPWHYSILKSIQNDKEVFLKGKKPKKADMLY